MNPDEIEASIQKGTGKKEINHKVIIKEILKEILETI